MLRLTDALPWLRARRQGPVAGGMGALEAKASATAALIRVETVGQPVWSPRDATAFAREGFMQNAIVYRSVRMVAEAAASIPLLLYEGDREIETHALLGLLRRPAPGQTTADLLEAWIGYLLVAGNAYVEAVANGGTLRELHVLRPDRCRVVAGPSGWPEAYEYCVDGEALRFPAEVMDGVPPVLHMRLFHPLNDHYGLSPLAAAAAAIDIHNAASAWNKALLDNAARPSGALVYAVKDGRLTSEQFERLKGELEATFSGARNAGRPLLLEGGLDWKPLSMSPKDMDFLEAKNGAAREIALAIGVPPMLLGIPGDNTYSNYQEASRAFWRQTVLPLAGRVARALSGWLAPAYGGGLELRPDLDAVEALSSERDGLWRRLEAASFLTQDEKRLAAGYGPGGTDAAGDAGGPVAKMNPFHDDVGRFTFAPGSGAKPAAFRPRGPVKPPPSVSPTKPTTPQQPTAAQKPTAPITPAQKLEDILKPSGKDVGIRQGGASSEVRTVSSSEFDAVQKLLLEGSAEVPAPSNYKGRWYRRSDGTTIGVRDSSESGPTLDVVDGAASGLRNGYRIHRK